MRKKIELSTMTIIVHDAGSGDRFFFFEGEEDFLSVTLDEGRPWLWIVGDEGRPWQEAPQLLKVAALAWKMGTEAP